MHSSGKPYRLALFLLATLAVETGGLSAQENDTVSFIDEVVIKPGKNPALPIMAKVLEHKDENNFERYPAYSYRNYFKFLPKEAFRDSSRGSRIDSLLWLSEMVSLCSKRGPHVQHRIIATRTAGLSSPVIGQLFYIIGQKAISFYNHAIPMLGSDIEADERIFDQYLSPLCHGALRAYTFYLADSYRQGHDTIFEIQYHPKRYTNFIGLKGTLFISSNGYALTRVTARPAGISTIDFRFRQDYRLVEGRWFPSTLESEFSFGQPEKMRITWLGYSSIDSVSLSEPKTVHGSFDKIYLDEKGRLESEAILAAARPVPLSPIERRSYTVFDSLFDAHPFLNNAVDAIPKLMGGKIPVGKIDIDFLHLYTYNEHERSRFGIGLHTNENLMRYVSIGGYAGYGVGDRRWKRGGDIEFTLNRQRNAHLSYAYQNTLRETGSDRDYTLFNLWGKTLLATHFEYLREHRVAADYRITAALRVDATLLTKDVSPAFDYSWRGIPLRHYRDNAMQVALRFAPGEKTMMLGYSRYAVKAGNPILSLAYTHGLQLNGGGFDYNRLEATVDLMFYHGRIGQTDLRLQAGYIDRPLPYPLLFTGEGSKGHDLLSIVIRNTFQTMKPNEFLSDRYTRAFFSHNFGRLFAWGFLRPELTVTYNAGWGRLRQPSLHGIAFKIQDKVYQETGAVIDNLLRINVLGAFYLRAGIGGFCRLGHYRFRDFKDGCVLKYSITMSFEK